MSLVDRVNRGVADLRGRDGTGLSLDDLAETFMFGGNPYPIMQTSMSMIGDEHIAATANDAFKGNGPIYALIQARMQAFSQVRFQWTQFVGSQPGDLFGTPELSVLERPWPGGTTSDLLARMEIHASVAGCAFVTRPKPNRLSVLRPDRVTIILGSQTDADHAAEAPDCEIAGFIHSTSSGDVTAYLPHQVAYYAPIPDPDCRFLGMSWITPVIRELQSDQLMTEHKARFMTNAATPNMAIKFDPTISVEQVKRFKAILETEHRGAWNAYKTLYLGGGADPVVIGKDFRQLDFASTQGKGESRLAAAAGVPPSWVGFSEGLQGSSLNSGNFQAARRRFSDGPQPLDAKILTQGGWATMGDVQPGMQVIGSDGRGHRVLDVFDQPAQDVYRVDFIDGTSVECTLGHSWTVSRESRRETWRTLTLGQIMEAGFQTPGRPPTWAVPLPDPIDYGPEADLPLDPYLLGLLLGDGTFSGEVRLTCGREDADETQSRIAELLPAGVSIRRQDRPDGAVLYLPGSAMATRRYHGHDTAAPRSVMGLAVESLGLLGVHGRDKFIPWQYLSASVKNRVALLQGLIDSDGCVTTQGSVRFTNGAPALINGVMELARSLGGLAWLRGVTRGDVQEVAISRLPTGIVPARLLRKQSRLGCRTWRRAKSMIGAELVRHVPTRCIKIDSPDSLYVTDGFTLTHNTMYHLWTSAATALETLVRPPNSGASLWFDSRVPFMREDADQVAAIQSQQAGTIASLIAAGFIPDTAVKAVMNNDWSLLRHSGLVSVQLLPADGTPPPGQPGDASSNGKAPSPAGTGA